MDGDLDIVVGVRAATTLVLRNNGDGTWRPLQPFPDATGVRAFVWGDIDGDGDPDAASIDESGALQVFANLQAGQFKRFAGPPSREKGYLALAIGDVNADGALDLVTLETLGAIRRASLVSQRWNQEPWTAWPELEAGKSSSPARLFLADLDNNGALDLVVSGPAPTAIWLSKESRTLQRLNTVIDADVWNVLDLSADGQLDLVGLSAGRAVRLNGRGTRGYHHQVVRPRAQTAAGDQRINSFGIGGEVEVRSGLLVQKQTIAAATVHVGLGTRTSIDVTRIVWPNGVPQAEFDPAVDRPIVAQQRLKGSCPWIFADDGNGMRFVTDFLWRSPLGLRINAQDTAGVTQTEDWVKIRGDQLVARDGAYDVRITAELWETHFVDHVSLMVVDRPEEIAVFVDERFARESPALAVRATRPVQPVKHAWDETGRDVTDLVSRQDGRYLGTFERGRYQGVAVDHFVEFELGARGFPACADVARRSRVRVSDRQQHQRGDCSRRTAETSRAVSGSTGCHRPLDRRGAGSRVSGRKEQDDPDRSRSRRARRRFGCAPVAAADQSGDLLGLTRICRRRERCAAQEPAARSGHGPTSLIEVSR